MRIHPNLASIFRTQLFRSVAVATSVALGITLIGANPANASTGTEPQVITWTDTPAYAAPLAVNSMWSLSAASDSGLEVTIGTNTPDVCTFDSGTLTIISGTGTCEYYAEQLGDETYAAATTITESVGVAKLSQNLYFDPISNQSDANSSLSINFGVDSTLAAIADSDTPDVCSVSGYEITILSPGTCSITVSQPGDDSYDAASPITQSFLITSAKPTTPRNVWVERGSQQVTVHWNEVTGADAGDASVDSYTATASPNGGSCTTLPNETSCTINNLVNGNEYEFSVVATNVFGDSQPSTPMGPGIGVDVPSWQENYSCGIDDSKGVQCWGDDNSGRVTPPTNLKNVKEIGVANYHACALTEDGKVTCWGYNGDGRSTVPNDLPIAEHLSVGDTQNCIITFSGTLSCFGVANSNFDIPSDLGTVSAVSVGYLDICAIKTSGQVVCWGQDYAGIVTEMPSGLDNVTRISFNWDQACALKSNNTYICWGSEVTQQASPTITGQIAKVSALNNRTCVLTTLGALTCWGDDHWGRNSRKPADLPPVQDFEISRTHTCVTLMDGGGVRCWGYDNAAAVQVPGILKYGSKLLMASIPTVPQNVFARRADKSVTISLEPSASNGGAPITRYEVVTSSSTDKRCTIEPTDAVLECTITGLTNGRSYSFSVRAINVAGSSKAAQPLDAINISGVSGYTQCAVLTNNNVTCWGGNPDVDVIRLLPRDLNNAVAVATNGEQLGGCVVTTIGTIRCWGRQWGVTEFNGNGIPTDSGYIGITSSQYTFCAWKESGDVSCWGWDGYNQLAGFSDLGPVSKVIGTREHGFCAVLKDNTHFCWGSTASVDQTSAPGFVKDFSGSSNSWCAIDMAYVLTCVGSETIYNNIPSDLGFVKAVTLEVENACAIKLDDTVACWGNNGYGLNNVPADLGTVRSVYLGWNESACAIRNDGMPQCWGLGESRASVPTGLTMTPGRAPSPPFGVGARNTTAGVEISWPAVADNGGFEVTGYTVTATPGGKTCSTSVTSCIIKGLTNGQQYTFRVTATNEIGTSAPSADTFPAVGVAVESGYEPFNCVIVGGRQNIECWGYDYHGRTLPPTDFEDVVEIDLGETHGCAVNESGALRCWGLQNSGEVPSGIEPVTKLSVGKYKTCVITSTQDLHCWSINGAVEIPDNVGKVIDVSVGIIEICAIREDGSVTCWSEISGSLPDPDPAITDATSIAVGHGSACAVRVGGTLTCWGSRADLVPNDIGTVKKIDIIFDNGFCAITTADKLRCWGDDFSGRFSQIPTFLEGVKDVSINQNMTCVTLLNNKGVRCWGYPDELRVGGLTSASKYGSTITASVQPSAPRNAFAVFGDGKATVYFEAPSNNGGLPVTSYIVKAQGTSRTCEVVGTATDLSCDVTGLTNGTKYTFSVFARNDVGISKSANAIKALDISGMRGLGYCVVKLDNKVACWGWVDSFGVKNEIPSNLPLAKKVAISGEMDSGCIITMQDKVRCWGGGWGNSGSEVASALTDVVQIEMGQYHACALTRDGTVSCWGYPDAERTAVPSDLGPVSKIFTSMSSTCALQRDGQVRCWGADNPSAEILSQFTDVIDLGMGDGTWCVIRSDNSLTCYGSDARITNLPAGLSSVKSVTLGDGNACAILDDNSATCWGNNDWGKNEVPSVDAGVAKIVAGRDASSCLLDPNGEIYCWGYPGDGRAEVITTVTTIPGGPPSSPNNVVAENSPRGVRVTWEAPVDNGGYPVTGYTATAQPGNQTCSTTVGVSGRTLSCVISGIESGALVTVIVTASTLAGTSEGSLPSAELAVVYAPSSPLSIVSTVENEAVVVNWQTPATDGGSPITGYTAYIPQTDARCSTLVEDENPLTCSLSIPTLANYDVIVYATNAIGNSIHFTFDAPRKQQMYFSPYSVMATASDGEVVNMATSTPEICGVISSAATSTGKSSSKVSLLSPGTCILVASVPGGAPSVTRSFQVKAAHRFTGLNVKLMRFDRVINWTEDGREVCYEGTTPLIDSDTTWPGGRVFDTDCPRDNFIIHYTGAIKWPGVYDGVTTSEVVFRSHSDDGFRLDIDSENIIDDPTYHGPSGPTSSPITKLAGQTYSFEAWMFQGDGGYSSQLFWNTGNGEEIIPSSAFDAGMNLPKETQSLTWSGTTLALESGRVGQLFTLSATSDADASVISYGTETSDTCEITGEDMNEVKIIDDSGPCTFVASSEESENIVAATPITHTIETTPGYGVTITDTNLSGVLPYYLDNFVPGDGAVGNNYRNVAGTSNVPEPLSNTIGLYCVPQDRTLTPINLVSDVPLNENGSFEVSVEIPRNIGGVTGCKLAGAITGQGVIDTWDSLQSDPIRPIFIGTTLTDNAPTDVSIDYWGTEGRASYGLDWACPLCAMHAANDNGSFATANQSNPMSIDNVNHSLWSYAGAHNPTAANDNFKLADPSNPNSTIDYSDFTVDGQPVYTSKMAIDLGVSFGADTPSIDVGVTTYEPTGAFIITETSPLWRCTVDDSKLWDADCGNVIQAPVTMTRVTTIQPTGTSYYIEDSYTSTDGQAHTLVTASEMHSTSAANLQIKITSGITSPMSDYRYVEHRKNFVGTGSSLNILAKFDGQGNMQDNETVGSASFSPSPSRFVTANAGPNETSAHAMSVVYENQEVPANGTLKLRQAYSIASDESKAAENALSSNAFLETGRSMLGQHITFDEIQNPEFTAGSTSIHGHSTANLKIAYASATPLVCSVGTSTLVDETSSATVSLIGAGTCRINASQVGNEYFRSTTNSLEFTVLLSAPTIPRNVAATITGKTATVRWLAPVASGGSPITKYVVTATSGTDVVTSTVNRVGNSAAPTSATLSTLRQGLTYQVTVTASNSDIGLQTGLTSSATSAINIKVPAIVYSTGLKWTVVGNKPVKVGNTLSATRGTWLGSGITPKFQWFRCAKAFAGAGKTGVANKIPTTGSGRCVAIPKATAATYKLVKSDKGKFIVLSVKAVNAGLPAGVTMYTKSTTAVK